MQSAAFKLSILRNKLQMNDDNQYNDNEVDQNEDNGNGSLPIVRDFDKLCFEYGDRDAILQNGSDPDVSYFELQEYSKVLAYQLYHRFGWPDYVLVDCQG